MSQNQNNQNGQNNEATQSNANDIKDEFEIIMGFLPTIQDCINLSHVNKNAKLCFDDHVPHAFKLESDIIEDKRVNGQIFLGRFTDCIKSDKYDEARELMNSNIFNTQFTRGEVIEYCDDYLDNYYEMEMESIKEYTQEELEEGDIAEEVRDYFGNCKSYTSTLKISDSELLEVLENTITNNLLKLAEENEELLNELFDKLRKDESLLIGFNIERMVSEINPYRKSMQEANEKEMLKNNLEIIANEPDSDDEEYIRSIQESERMDALIEYNTDSDSYSYLDETD